MGGATPLISKEDIIDRAVQLAKVQPLSDISIASLAKEFGVTPALIHYYAGSRDELLSGVVNRYFQARIAKLPPPSGDWRHDIELHAHAIFRIMKEYGGVLRYIMAHNRFRLFQQVGEGEIDYGLEYLNRLATIFKDGGFTAQQSAMAYHLLAQYVMTAAYADVNRQLPADHGKYILGRIQATEPGRYPGAHFIAQKFAEVDSTRAFQTGLTMLLNGIEGWKGRKNPLRASDGSGVPR